MMSAADVMAGPVSRTADTTYSTDTSKALRRQAVREALPVALSVAPFGLAVGVAGQGIGQSLGGGLVGGFAIFGGSAHLTALTMLGTGADLIAVLAAVLVIQSRLIVYSAALESEFRHQPRWFRWLGPHFLVDQTFAMAKGRTDLAQPERFRRYWLTVGTVIGFGWLAMIGLGLVLGRLIPVASPLEFAAAAVFIGLLVPRLRDRHTVVIALVAAVVAAAASSLPTGLGLITGVAAGIAVAAIGEAIKR